MTFLNQVILECEFHIIICSLIFTLSNVIVQLYEPLRKQVINLSCQYNKIKWSDRGEMHSWSKKPPQNCNFWRKKERGNSFGVDCRKFCKGYCHEFSHRDSNYPKYPNKQEFYVGWLHCIEFTWFVTPQHSWSLLQYFPETF